MAYILSKPIEDLIQDQPSGDICDKQGNPKKIDVLIVGSGYGGAIAAMRLAGLDSVVNRGGKISVYVFERGSEYAPGDFPESLEDLPGHVQFLQPDRDVPTGYAEALFDFRIGESVSVLVGNGLGGGSLINANVAMEPDDALYNDPAWPKEWKKEELRSSFEDIRKLLGVKPADFKGTNKYQALKRLAESLGSECKPVNIAITQKQNSNSTRIANAVGIHQNTCIGCGNCVTGCNVGAKNSLAMNALPLAKRHGAEIYTGATVLSLEPDGSLDGSNGWKVRFRRTAVSKTVLHREVFTLSAKVVILAAGTLGSTEILIRSEKRAEGPQFSEKLGSCFSTNGDALAFGYAQKNKVNAVGCTDFKNLTPGSAIGPTITGYFNATYESGHRREDKNPMHRRKVTIEDGVIPSALAHLFGEVITTAGLAKRYEKGGLPAWFKDNHDKDPLAMHPEALGRSQVLLGMGDDGAAWRLELKNGEAQGLEELDRAQIRVVSPAPVERQTVFDGIDDVLKKAEDWGGFDGGAYVRNPFWKLLPEGVDPLSSTGNLLSVHPLGGCPMGENVESGVVNHFGQVFRRYPNQLNPFYSGLYVMDGAILPCALGVNPFLTIAALAYRNAAQVAQFDLNGQAPQRVERLKDSDTTKQKIETVLQEARAKAQPPSGQIRKPASVNAQTVSDYPIQATFEERMIGRLESVPEWLIHSFEDRLEGNVRRLREEKSLVVSVKVTIKDILKWLRSPNDPLPASARLLFDKGAGTSNEDLIELVTSMSVGKNKSEVVLLSWNRPKYWFEKVWRALRAIRTFISRRPSEISDLRSFLKVLTGFRALWRFSCNHADWRSLNYQFVFEGSNGKKMILKGRKELAYAMDRKDPWTALTELPVTLSDESGESVQGLLKVDLLGLTRRSPFQVQSINTPETIAAMGSVGMMMLRILFQTHFWSFPAPDYPKKTLKWKRHPGTIFLTNRTVIEPERFPLWVEESEDNRQRQIPLRLTRYRREGASRGSILLIHGFAQSSVVFALETINVNLVKYLYENGYDVWLLDYRLSTARTRIAERQWTLDQMAEFDIPEAVKFVYKRTGNQPVQVFAHCLGAISIAMAVLKGRCHDQRAGRSMIKALCTHAIHPWLVASEMNRMHANLAAFFRDAISLKTLNAVPPKEDSKTLLDNLIDRISGSFPVAPKGGFGGHGYNADERMGSYICNRMTLFYGYSWNHWNLSPETHQQLGVICGMANLESFRHLQFMILRRRLTDHDGRNVYLTERNVKNYWSFPTLFLHGRDSQVFDPVSAEASCLRLRALKSPVGTTPRTKDTYCFVVKNYGHMDVLFGKDAYKEVYPYIDAFFRQGRGLAEKWDQIKKYTPDSKSVTFLRPARTPACGPIIGWVRRKRTNDSNIEISLRIWVEMSMYTDFAPAKLKVVPYSGVKKLVEHLLPAPDKNPNHARWGTRSTTNRRRYYPGEYQIYDISVSNDYEKGLKLLVQDPDTKKNFPVNIPDLPGYEQLTLRDLDWFKHLQKPNDSKHRSFLVGSCRYPGSPFEEDLSDRIFQAMQQHVAASKDVNVGNGSDGGRNFPENVDHVLFVGDQIYADATADLFNTRELSERYAGRYREAFGSENLRRLLRSVPIYMALDDHEFEDNWPGRADSLAQNNPEVKDYMERYSHAFAAALAYQWSMSPRIGWNNCPVPGDSGLWYKFNSGFPFFVMDTRTERKLHQAGDSWNEANLIGDRQFRALKDWLKRQNKAGNRPKFIVSGTVLAPPSRVFVDQKWLYRNNDGWAGYPATWRALAEFIVKEQIQNVIFIAGDYHLSSLSELTFEFKEKGKKPEKPVTAYQITSSALFSPLPFANGHPSEFDWGKPTTLPFSDDASQCAYTRLSVTPYLLCTKGSHFLRIDVQSIRRQWSIDISVCNQEGVIIPEEWKNLRSPFRLKRGSDRIIQWDLKPKMPPKKIPDFDLPTPALQPT